MSEKQFNTMVTAEVPAAMMQTIYARLEDEAIPYALRVGQLRPYMRKVTIHCDINNLAHFKAVINDEDKTEI